MVYPDDRDRLRRHPRSDSSQTPTYRWGAAMNIERVERACAVEYSGDPSELLNIFGHDLVTIAVKSQPPTVFMSD
jgi:hypothetical protein